MGTAGRATVERRKDGPSRLRPREGHAEALPYTGCRPGWSRLGQYDTRVGRRRQGGLRGGLCEYHTWITVSRGGRGAHVGSARERHPPRSPRKRGYVFSVLRQRVVGRGRQVVRPEGPWASRQRCPPVCPDFSGHTGAQARPSPGGRLVREPAGTPAADEGTAVPRTPNGPAYHEAAGPSRAGVEMVRARRTAEAWAAEAVVPGSWRAAAVRRSRAPAADR